jgi:nicotinamidase-related amidase
MTAANTALLIIDAQMSFRHRPYWSEEDVPIFIEHIQMLADGAKASGLPIVQVFHVADDGPFAENSGHVTTLAPLAIAPDAVFRKRRHSALVRSGLDVWLTSNGLHRLIVCGIRTEQCCETTTRHASDLGYEVHFVSEAMLTFAMTGADGHRWTAADIRARTELVLAGRFARISTVSEALAA